MSVPDPRKDPRFRRYRGAAWGVYILLTTVFSVWILWSVSRSVASMTPERPPATDQLLGYRECLDGAQALWAELESEREKLVRVSPAKDVDRQWMRVRTEWLQRLRQREALCGLASRDREPLRVVFRRLESVQDLYTIHAVQYAGEVGASVDALHAAFATARTHAGAGRLP
ncbi:hypothetical protein [Pyxidicoccus trucidator]|uniref:hypothetical protein n=1 Tax=Pyxidicoccus trucidator TaxID=2709662 RepID=UPI0019687337|nr:hypothetical protein [Pyxidicoccus trucidator]